MMSHLGSRLEFARAAARACPVADMQIPAVGDPRDIVPVALSAGDPRGFVPVALSLWL